MPKTLRWLKVRIFDKKRGPTPWKNFDFLDCFKNSFFRSKTCALYPDYPKTTFPGLICPQKNLIKSSTFLTNAAWTNPLRKLRLFVLLLKRHFSGLKSFFSIQKIQKRSFLAWFAQKTQLIYKQFVFLTKTCDGVFSLTPGLRSFTVIDATNSQFWIKPKKREKKERKKKVKDLRMSQCYLFPTVRFHLHPNPESTCLSLFPA